MTHPLSSAEISVFHRKLRTFVISRNADIVTIFVHDITEKILLHDSSFIADVVM